MSLAHAATAAALPRLGTRRESRSLEASPMTPEKERLLLNGDEPDDRGFFARHRVALLASVAGCCCAFLGVAALAGRAPGSIRAALGQRPFSPEWLKQAEAIYQGLDAGLTHEDKDAIATLAVHHAGSNQHHFIWDHDYPGTEGCEATCEGHDVTEEVCTSLFFCEWDQERCWSAVGPNPCPLTREIEREVWPSPDKVEEAMDALRDKAEGVIDAPPEYIAEAERMWEDMEMNRKEDYEGQHERKIREMAKEMHRRHPSVMSEEEILEQIHGHAAKARLKAMEEARAMALAAENARAEMELFGDDVRAHLLAPAPAPARAHAYAPAHAPARAPAIAPRAFSPRVFLPDVDEEENASEDHSEASEEASGASDAYEADEADEAETRRDAGFRGMWSGLMPKWVAPAPAAARGMGPRGEARARRPEGGRRGAAALGNLER